jgi:hypothetical protein
VINWLQEQLELDPVRHQKHLQRVATSGLHGALLFWNTYVIQFWM